MFTNDDGFTLVELLVSIVILTVGLLGLLQTVNLAMDHNMITQFRNEAVSMADDQMMQAKNLNFDNISSSSAAPKGSVISRDFRNAFKNYSVNKTITTLTLDSEGAPKSKEIVIIVSWKHKNQRFQHVLSSIVSSSK